MATQGEPSESAPPSRRRTQQARGRRYEPTPVYVLAEQLKREGVALHNLHGPWRPIWRRLLRPGRNAEPAIPIVTNGAVQIAVDTAEHAADLSGFLNLASLDHLDPVPNLRAPDQDLVGD